MTFINRHRHLISHSFSYWHSLLMSTYLKCSSMFSLLYWSVSVDFFSKTRLSLIDRKHGIRIIETNNVICITFGNSHERFVTAHLYIDRRCRYEK